MGLECEYNDTLEKKTVSMLPLYGKEQWIPDHKTHKWTLQFLVNREANDPDQKQFIFHSSGKV